MYFSDRLRTNIRTEIRRLDDRLRAVELAVKPDPPAE